MTPDQVNLMCNEAGMSEQAPTRRLFLGLFSAATSLEQTATTLDAAAKSRPIVSTESIQAIIQAEFRNSFRTTIPRVAGQMRWLFWTAHAALVVSVGLMGTAAGYRLGEASAVNAAADVQAVLQAAPDDRQWFTELLKVNPGEIALLRASCQAGKYNTAGGGEACSLKGTAWLRVERPPPPR